ncbi:MAG: hypothetical protein J6R59_09520 [Paludibacteraceae bacterium]|nr:hypothetical protein [Paludibacteraceae bacterium]
MANEFDNNITIINKNRAKAILEQAKRQIKATGGKVEIEWHVSIEMGAKIFSNSIGCLYLYKQK